MKENNVMNILSNVTKKNLREILLSHSPLLSSHHLDSNVWEGILCIHRSSSNAWVLYDYETYILWEGWCMYLMYMIIISKVSQLGVINEQNFHECFSSLVTWKKSRDPKFSSTTISTKGFRVIGCGPVVDKIKSR